MALIKCPECGKEISDRAVSCPGCGCPVEVKTNLHNKPELLPEDEQPEMFPCYNCGRSLPIGIDICPFCEYEYIENRPSSACNSTLTCSKCGSNNVIVQLAEEGSATIVRDTSGAYKIGRAAGDAATLGVNKLLSGKKTSVAHTTNNHIKYAICQNCGNHWAMFDPIERFLYLMKLIFEIAPAVLIVGLIVWIIVVLIF